MFSTLACPHRAATSLAFSPYASVRLTSIFFFINSSTISSLANPLEICSNVCPCTFPTLISAPHLINSCSISISSSITNCIIMSVTSNPSTCKILLFILLVVTAGIASLAPLSSSRSTML
eukprot:NODE_388_length_9508_cov_0.225954.p8 type:complete len:120 gc:universal NODE_388_length_9508_cov_0.225954:6569-6210(-)